MICYSSQTSIRYCAIFDHAERLIFNSHQNLEGHCFTHLSNSGEHGGNNKITNVCCVMKKIIKSFYSKFEGLLVPERKRHCIWMETNGEWRPSSGVVGTTSCYTDERRRGETETMLEDNKVSEMLSLSSCNCSLVTYIHQSSAWTNKSFWRESICKTMYFMGFGRNRLFKECVESASFFFFFWSWKACLKWNFHHALLHYILLCLS